MSKLLYCAILVAVTALLACSSATPTPAPTNTLAPAATMTPEPTATTAPEPTATTAPEPTATTAPEPTATTAPEPTAMPDQASATGSIAPLRMDDPQAFLAELSGAEQSCFSEDVGPQRLAALIGNPELASPEETEQLIQCLSDDTLLRLFLTGLISEAGRLSDETSMCIRAGFSEIDLRSIMLTSSIGGDEGAAMAGSMTSMILTISCMNEQEWEAAGPSLGAEPGERETIQCVMEELGGPEGVVAALLPTEGGDPNQAFFEAALKCGTPMMEGSPGG